MSRAWPLALALALSALAGGCDDHGYGHLDLKVTTAAPAQAQVSAARVTLPVGSAVGVEARAYEEDGDPIEGSLMLQSDSPDILGLTTAPEAGTFVLFGRAVGRGAVRVLVDGDQVDAIEVEVVAQPD